MIFSKQECQEAALQGRVTMCYDTDHSGAL